MANTEHRPNPRGAEPAHHPTDGYERRDTDWRMILKLLGGLTTATVVVVYLLWVLFVSLGRQAGGGASAVSTTDRLSNLPPEPRLQLSPRKDMEDMRAQEDRILNSYGWVDRARGRVRLPIARAMELTLREGLPTRPAEAVQARDRMTSRAADSASGRFVERRPFL